MNEVVEIKPLFWVDNLMIPDFTVFFKWQLEKLSLDLVLMLKVDFWWDWTCFTSRRSSWLSDPVMIGHQCLVMSVRKTEQGLKWWSHNDPRECTRSLLPPGVCRGTFPVFPLGTILQPVSHQRDLHLLPRLHLPTRMLLRGRRSSSNLWTSIINCLKHVHNNTVFSDTIMTSNCCYSQVGWCQLHPRGI